MSTDVTLDATAWEGVDANAQALVDSWKVEPRERVAAGQTLARVVLVKSNIDVPSPVAGIVEKILVPSGETFGPGQALATITGD